MLPAWPSWALTRLPLRQSAAAFSPGRRACAGRTARGQGERASPVRQRGARSRGAGARGSPRPDGFCVLRTGQQSQPQSSQSDYSKAWEDYYRKQSECGAFPAGRPRSQLRARGLTVHGPGRHPFFHVCLCASVSVLTFVSLCPSVSDAE